MIQAISAALGGMDAGRARVDAAANNLANLATPGFQAARAIQTAAPGGPRVSFQADAAPGPIAQTGGATDYAIAGGGFFRVVSGSGDISTTRNGAFIQDSEGYLRTADGGYVLDGAGRIKAPAGASVGIDTTGVVFAASSAGTLPIGVLSLAASPGGPAAGAPGTNGLGKIVPGALEQSNTDMVGSMVGLIVGSNSFAANAKVIHVTDEMMKKAYQLQGSGRRS